eukprot:1155662-Pelagomonas_calceolata.AAC.4
MSGECVPPGPVSAANKDSKVFRRKASDPGTLLTPAKEQVTKKRQIRRCWGLHLAKNTSPQIEALQTGIIANSDAACEGKKEEEKKKRTRKHTQAVRTLPTSIKEKRILRAEAPDAARA